MRRLFAWLMLLPIGLLACTTTPLIVVPVTIVSATQGAATTLPSSTPSAISMTQPATLAATSAFATLPPILPSPTALPLPQWENPLQEMMLETAVSQNAQFHSLLPSNSGLWQYDPGTFLHPIALAMNSQTAFLLDGGRVMALDLLNVAPPRILLQPGDTVEEMLVQEPLDLALVGGQLLVLDRAGDVYGWDLETAPAYSRGQAVWQLERGERPIGASSSHYFVALGHDTAGGEMRLRLETSYSYAQYYFPNGQQRIWSLPEGVLPLDVSGVDDLVYILWRNGDGTATVALFQDTGRLTQFAPAIPISQPRQIVATKTAVYLLDNAGERLLSLHPQTGRLQAIWQLPTVTTFASNKDGTELFFAGRERLYFWQEPARSRFVPGGETLIDPQPHDTAVWQTNTTYAWPITGNALDLTRRDLQMPGAPRHYRLGVHQGVDFYWSGGTPVYAAAAGVVIRATVDYERPSATTFNQRRAQNLELGYTAPDNLDFYRGRQVWILQEDGFVARYAHLSEIAWGVEEGTAVTTGQQIGLIGNSGSPASVDSQTADAHLHFELWFEDVYLGQFLRPIETRELLEQLFAP
ncbi:MAG: M23 family metallopeptidase [Chloroflexi bacterium]|nr:M23 family metallopeptidase [Chloroflexota bacterium]